MSRLPKSEQQRIMLELAVAVQHAADLDAVLAHLLSAVTGELDLKSAVVTLVDREEGVLYPWMQLDRGQANARLLESRRGSLEATSNPLIDCLHGEQPTILDLSDDLGISHAFALPLRWGAQPIGILIVDLEGHEDDAEQCDTLQKIADHTAVSIGMMQTRHRHAKESAIHEERARLALDLHDTVSQSMFGLVFALQACLPLLPEDRPQLRSELEWALQTAEEVRRTIRAAVSDLWPAELTAEQFESDLRQYAADTLQAAELDITFDVRGDFGALSPPVRRSIYRISQEALTNVVHHAGARESRLCVDIADGRVQLIVRDNGRGFDPQTILAQPYSANHFGLRGMQERAAALGGTCRIYSQPDAGASIVVDIPANIQSHHQ